MNNENTYNTNNNRYTYIYTYIYNYTKKKTTLFFLDTCKNGYEPLKIQIFNGPRA